MRFNRQVVLSIGAFASAVVGLPQSSFLAERNGGTAITKAPRAGELFERQWVCCEGQCPYKLVGDGDPHTDYLHKQISEPNNCGAGSQGSDDGCGATYSKSYTVGWSASVSGSWKWFSGGFSVQESVTTGDSYSCTAGPGETVCVWANIPHTAYTVDIDIDLPDYCNKQPHGPLVMESPTGEIDYYCVRGDACQVAGYQDWCYTEDGC